MSQPKPLFLIDGRAVHKTSNALKLTFTDGPGDTPLAVGEQGSNDGKGKKFATLLGFKNGGTGNHRLTLRDGSLLNVGSNDGKPSTFTRADGTPVATAERGATTTVLDPAHEALLIVSADPVEAKTPDLFRLQVASPAGAPIAQLDVIRRAAGWSLARTIENELIWWDRAGQPLPIPILGTRITGYREISELERDLLLGICVDIAIGLRPYVTEMQ